MTRKPPTQRQSRLNDALHPPTDVRVVGVDGTEYPVQTVYAGVEDGCQMFEVVDAPNVRITNIRVGVLPGETAVVFPRDVP